jgi:hypothetical protein
MPGNVDGVLVAAAAESHVSDGARDVVLIGVAGAQLDPGRPDHQQRGRPADGQARPPGPEGPRLGRPGQFHLDRAVGGVPAHLERQLPGQPGEPGHERRRGLGVDLFRGALLAAARSRAWARGSLRRRSANAALSCAFRCGHSA